MPNARVRPAVLIFTGGGYHSYSDREAGPIAGSGPVKSRLPDVPIPLGSSPQARSTIRRLRIATVLPMLSRRLRARAIAFLSLKVRFSLMIFINGVEPLAHGW